jgi:hypothetical protein
MGSLTAAPPRASAALLPPQRTRTVVLIVSDGLRWQEIFTGAEEALLSDREGGNWVPEAQLRQRYWRPTAAERRAALFPFLWGTVAKQGQIYGNQALGSIAHVTNGKAFSYPGYNEMSTGYPNDAIDSNEFGPNPNPTVFEWLNKFAELRGRVAIYGTWKAYDDIFNKARSWIAVMGPDTAALGERSQVATVTQAEIAATLAAFMGKDYPAAEPKAAAPILGVLSGTH